MHVGDLINQMNDGVPKLANHAKVFGLGKIEEDREIVKGIQESWVKGKHSR